eukprot:m51a1_g7675 hypothetical protein (752) ;mRNA; r:516412-520342
MERETEAAVLAALRGHLIPNCLYVDPSIPPSRLAGASRDCGGQDPRSVLALVDSPSLYGWASCALLVLRDGSVHWCNWRRARRSPGVTHVGSLDLAWSVDSIRADQRSVAVGGDRYFDCPEAAPVAELLRSVALALLPRPAWSAYLHARGLADLAATMLSYGEYDRAPAVCDEALSALGHFPAPHTRVEVLNIRAACSMGIGGISGHVNALGDLESVLKIDPANSPLRGHSIPRCLFVEPDIPPSKLATAARDCGGQDPRSVLALVDSTFFGSASCALLFLRDGSVHWHNRRIARHSPGVWHMAAAELARSADSIRPLVNEHSVAIGGDRYYDCSALSPSQTEHVAELLRSVAVALHPRDERVPYLDACDLAHQAEDLRKRGQYERAQAVCTDALNALGDFPAPRKRAEVLVQRATCAIGIGGDASLKAAQGDLERALQIDPANSRALMFKSLFDTEQMTEAAVLAALQGHSIPRCLFVEPDIPPSKLATAARDCGSQDPRSVLALVDSTVFGSASCALLFLRDGSVHWHNRRNALHSPGVWHMAAAELARSVDSIRPLVNETKCSVAIGGDHYYDCSALSPSQTVLVSKLLRSVALVLLPRDERVPYLDACDLAHQAEDLRKRGQYERAQAVCIDALDTLEDFPAPRTRAEVFMQRATCSMGIGGIGGHEAAQGDLERVLEIDPANCRALELKAAVALRLGNEEPEPEAPPARALAPSSAPTSSSTLSIGASATKLRLGPHLTLFLGGFN